MITWMATVWSIWLERNNVIFKGITANVERVADLIKLRSWFWIKANWDKFSCLLSEWLLDPISCTKSLK